MRFPVSASLLLASSLQAQQKDPAAAFDTYAAQAFKDWGAVGLAVAVVKDGRVVFARGYGVQELGNPAAVDTNTRFSIGSTTKAMTAAALGMLVDESKVRWDDPVTKYLPWFQLYDPYVTREVTVRDLLVHRAGLGNADVLWYESDNTPEDVLRLIRYAKPAYSLRSGWIYQNVMYAAAGAVVQAASGIPWQDFVRTRIFEPLGMRGTVATLAGTVGQPQRRVAPRSGERHRARHPERERRSGGTRWFGLVERGRHGQVDAPHDRLGTSRRQSASQAGDLERAADAGIRDGRRVLSLGAAHQTEVQHLRAGLVPA